MSDTCVKWGEETRKECEKYRDDGYNSCSSWDDRCCGWWPCSWGCKLVTWVCVGWYWVSNVVCVAWTYITTAVCLVWEVVITILVYIVGVVELIVGAIISVIDFVLELIFSIPILGRFVRELVSLIQEVFLRLAGLIDALAWLVGIRPEKKLRICVIILRDERGPVANPSLVLEEVQAAADIFREEANVRLIPVGSSSFKTPFHGDEEIGDDFLHIPAHVSSDNILNVSCGASSWGEDLWLSGSSFNFEMARTCFWGSARRLLGYGSSVTVFVVRSIVGKTGCSLGPLTDYVTVVGTETADKTTIAHETGHACGLWHVSENTNLMFENDSNLRRDMTNFQAINFRNSRHVTYL